MLHKNFSDQLLDTSANMIPVVLTQVNEIEVITTNT